MRKYLFSTTMFAFAIWSMPAMSQSASGDTKVDESVMHQDSSSMNDDDADLPGAQIDDAAAGTKAKRPLAGIIKPAAAPKVVGDAPATSTDATTPSGGVVPGQSAE